MNIEILAFGIAKDIFEGKSASIEVAGATVHDLKDALEERYPKLKALASYMIAVNDEYATDDTVVTATDEIAIIPPVSGG